MLQDKMNKKTTTENKNRGCIFSCQKTGFTLLLPSWSGELDGRYGIYVFMTDYVWSSVSAVRVFARAEGSAGIACW